jgi:hypothetical protein
MEIKENIYIGIHLDPFVGGALRCKIERGSPLCREPSCKAFDSGTEEMIIGEEKSYLPVRLNTEGGVARQRAATSCGHMRDTTIQQWR